MTYLEKRAKARLDALNEWKERRVEATGLLLAYLDGVDGISWDEVLAARELRDVAGRVWSTAWRRHVVAIEAGAK
ncbi:MAG: hypothetical protein GTN70_07905 [Deltaproteobacteria bacterium]|nr:hypothetical protein [Deltaproteobacteria bacterium]